MTLLIQGMLDVSEGHALRYAAYGVPDAPATVVLHGGPGSGCNESMLGWFDLSRQRVILFDQRGSGGSTPPGGLLHNTTIDLVADIERLRRHLGIDRWTVVGGSWGATLGLAYLGVHADAVQALILRGVFLPTAWQLDWFFQSLQALVPDAWEELAAGMTASERCRILPTLADRLLNGTLETQRDAARRWGVYEDAVMAAMRGQAAAPSPVTDRTLAKYRLQAHYLVHECFVTERQLLYAAQHADVPILCLHGTHDWICPPANARRLQRAAPHIDLRWIAGGTHPASDPLVANALRAAIAQAHERLR